MFDPLSFFFDFIAICFLTFIVLIGLSFLYRIFNAKPSETTYTYDATDTDREIEQDSIEDSQADLYLTDEPEDYDNLMFPEEFDDDDC